MNWNRGEDVVIAGSVNNEQAKELFGSWDEQEAVHPHRPRPRAGSGSSGNVVGVDGERNPSSARTQGAPISGISGRPAAQQCDGLQPPEPSGRCLTIRCVPNLAVGERLAPRTPTAGLCLGPPPLLTHTVCAHKICAHTEHPMWHTEHAHDTPASPEAVFALWADVEGWPAWDASLVATTLEGPFAAGTAGTLHPQGMPEPIAFVITAVEQGAGFADETRLGPLHLRFRHRVERRGDGSRDRRFGRSGRRRPDRSGGRRRPTESVAALAAAAQGRTLPA